MGAPSKGASSIIANHFTVAERDEVEELAIVHGSDAGSHANGTTGVVDLPTFRIVEVCLGIVAQCRVCMQGHKVDVSTIKGRTVKTNGSGI